MVGWLSLGSLIGLSQTMFVAFAAWYAANVQWKSARVSEEAPPENPVSSRGSGRDATAAAEKDRLAGIDVLRGLASLAVALLHFSNILEPGFVRTVLSRGYLGVHVFFVVSGFVIPYALARGRYRLADYGRFVLKRLVRLDPPYLVTLALILFLGFLPRVLPYEPVGTFSPSWPQILLHLGYVNVFFGYPWLSDVLWTLAIEFQYYLLIGLVFPLVASPRPFVRWGTMALLGASGFVLPRSAFVFYFMPIFLMGIAAFQRRIGLASARECAILVALSAMATVFRLNVEVMLVGLLAVATIAWVRRGHPVLLFLGTISYSLYLLHSPIGRRALNLARRIVGTESPLTTAFVFFFGVAAALVAAYLMYVTIERPSQRWSSAIRYRRAPPGTPPEPPALNPAP